MFIDLDIHCFARQGDTNPPSDFPFSSIRKRYRDLTNFKMFDNVTLPEHFKLKNSDQSVSSTKDSRSFAFGLQDFYNIHIITWEFKIDEMTSHPSMWIGVGACVRDVVLQNQPNWPCDCLGHGGFLVGSNGWTGSDNDIMINQKYSNTFSFDQGDIIEITYNAPLRTLSFIKKTCKDAEISKENKFIIPNVPPEARPCAVMLTGNCTVSFKT
jgi:hypothetical protein